MGERHESTEKRKQKSKKGSVSNQSIRGVTSSEALEKNSKWNVTRLDNEREGDLRKKDCQQKEVSMPNLIHIIQESSPLSL